MKNWRLLKWVVIGLCGLAIFLVALFNNIGDALTKYNKHFSRRPCQMEGVTLVYRFARREDDLYFLPKPTNGSLGDLQETGYVWDKASDVNVANRSKPACHKGKSRGENPDYFYCNDLGYYAKIPTDPPAIGSNEFIKGKREAHNYLIDLVLSPENVGGNIHYNVVSCFEYDKEPQM